MTEFWRHPQVPTYYCGATPIRCTLCASISGGCNGVCKYPVPSPQVGAAEVVQKGCICPPGSEKSCERWDCGRRSPGNYTIGGSFVGTLADATKKESP